MMIAQTRTEAGPTSGASADWRAKVSRLLSEALGASSLGLITAVGTGLAGAGRGWQDGLSIGALFAWGALRAIKLL